MLKKIKNIDLNKKRAGQDLTQYLMGLEVFDEVIDSLDTFKDDVFRQRVAGLLHSQLNTFLSGAVMDMLDDERFEAFKRFERSMYILADFMNFEDVLLEFAIQYDDLKEALLELIPDFLENFSERYDRFKNL